MLTGVERKKMGSFVFFKLRTSCWISWCPFVSYHTEVTHIIGLRGRNGVLGPRVSGLLCSRSAWAAHPTRAQLESICGVTEAREACGLQLFLLFIPLRLSVFSRSCQSMLA